ncbi:hypothetical protein A3709_20080 [Halioglobus sp. HI00S01]|nr:hypothetical protein A3709_20080 [Halioglobus sp. HI00S01]
MSISVVSGADIARDGLIDLFDIAGRVPGFTVLDQGSRGAPQVVARGINTDALAASEFQQNGGFSPVATYVGDVPVFIDLALTDIDRVEFLLGPQGTLYGAGTLAGAVRYIPNRADLSRFSGNVGFQAYSVSEAGDAGYEGEAVMNIPIINDALAFRGVLSKRSDPGFIDYVELVRTPGVSLPQPSNSNRADNIKASNDVNTEDITFARGAIRYAVGNADIEVAYTRQDTDTGGRMINSRDAFGTGRYESGMRIEEPNDKTTELFTAQGSFDLGFAQLTSATGYSEWDESGRRDQTDLLLLFDVGFDLFEPFVGISEDSASEERFSQEFRLVSTDDAPLNWIAGAFYSEYSSKAESREFTPGVGQFLVDAFGGVAVRTDDLEYISQTSANVDEMALFGELGYAVTDRLKVTVGGRYYDFESDVAGAFDEPLFRTAFGGDPADSIILDRQRSEASDDGFLLKAGAEYSISDNLLAYALFSEGYRIGGVNLVPACVDGQPDGPGLVCATDDELLIEPDETQNYEIGLKGAYLAGLTYAATLYFIDWDQIQISDVTENGAVPITSNGGEAQSYGVEVSSSWMPVEDVLLSMAYTYTNATLDQDAPGLVGGVDAFSGDRLPGTPEHQGFLSARYAFDLLGGSAWASWRTAYTGDIYTKVGNRNFGETLDSYVLHNATVGWKSGDLGLAAYVNNVFDEYAETGVRDDVSTIGSVGNVELRRYFKNVLRPREIGIRFSYDF